MSELRRFLGIINFNRRFIKDAASTQAPCHKYLEDAKNKVKRPIVWTTEAEAEFDKYKRALTNAALLTENTELTPRVDANGCSTVTKGKRVMETHWFLFKKMFAAVTEVQHVPTRIIFGDYKVKALTGKGLCPPLIAPYSGNQTLRYQRVVWAFVHSSLTTWYQEILCLNLINSGVLTSELPKIVMSDSGFNKIASGTDIDKKTKTKSNRNAVIAGGDASLRRRLASSKNKKRDVTDPLRSNDASSLNQEEDSVNKRVASSFRKHFSKTLLAKRSRPEKNPIPTKPNKKLGNVLAPRIQPAKMPRSYLELYRRRFSEPRYNVRSPEGSTLSIFGDSQQEQLTDEDTCLPDTPRDDQSELSFYRRLIEEFTDRPVTTIRSAGTLHQHVSEDTNVSHGLDMVKRDAISNKSKSLAYRPYTIEEYKTLPIPNLDRSLGPDKVEMQTKREWLMRRRSYGNSVSAHNRQRIVLQAQKLKPMRSAPQKCFLPPLKDKEVDVKMQSNSISSTIFEEQDTISLNGGTNYGKYSKGNIDVGKVSSSEKSKKFGRASSFGSSSNSRDVIEDSYLESLRQRHLYEKEMVDRIMSQALCP
nr:uncharacterized protein LOC116428804 [Nomia melanderi]